MERKEGHDHFYFSLLTFLLMNDINRSSIKRKERENISENVSLQHFLLKEQENGLKLMHCSASLRLISFI